MAVNYDFSGWASRNNLRCSDGRTIRRGAFKDNDGMTVPLVWNHDHNDPTNVLGHALLENRDEGTYAYCWLNDTDAGQSVKELVKHGDVKALSIYANHLKQNGGDVLHGSIKEVSVVLAGANPGAFIDSVIVHSFESEEDEDGAIIYTGEEISFKHSEEETAEEEVKEEEETPEEEEEKAEETEDSEEEEDEEKKDMAEDKNLELEHADGEGGETIQDVFDTLTDKQKDAVYAIVGMALEGDDIEEGDEVKHNAFDETYNNDSEVLTHSEMEEIFSDAKRYGSLKESVLQHGIDNIEVLFPDAKLTGGIQEIKRDDEWVAGVMAGTTHTPFSRVKSMYANLTADEARARGYIKGKYKKEEVFALLKREVTPTTIYKKQKLDRDDLIDITDFDIVSYMRGEMRSMLNEEIARAVLVSDGRLPSSEDKINEGNIIPIWKDEDLYSVKVNVEFAENDTDAAKAKKVIRAAVKNRKQYKGSGNPVLYTTEDWLTEMLLLEDLNQRVIYDSVDKLATAMRVSKIVTVPVMENLVRTSKSGDKFDLIGIIVNLKDYNIGADKGGAVNMFDDFDIDYNAQKYLIETRCSGALIKPYSAMVLETAHSGSDESDSE